MHLDTQRCMTEIAGDTLDSDLHVFKEQWIWFDNKDFHNLFFFL